jgi:hypothetical protein
MHADMTQQLQRPAHMPSNFTINAGEGGTKHWRGLSRRLNRSIGSGSSKLGLKEKTLRGLSAGRS